MDSTFRFSFRVALMGLIRFRCSDDLERRFEAAAQKADMQPSALARLVFERAFPAIPASQGGAGDASKTEARRYENRTEQIKTRLTKAESDEVQRRADALSMGRSTWLMRLIRAHLTKRPQLPPDAVKALREATRELSYIGRNLNQVAHALNINLNAREKASAELIAEINGQVNLIRQQVKDVLDENINRWGV